MRGLTFDELARRSDLSLYVELVGSGYFQRESVDVDWSGSPLGRLLYALIKAEARGVPPDASRVLGDEACGVGNESRSGGTSSADVTRSVGDSATSSGGAAVSSGGTE